MIVTETEGMLCYSVLIVTEMQYMYVVDTEVYIFLNSLALVEIEFNVLEM